jgi:hypothetical protein
MNVLTEQHQRPPRLIETGTGTISSAALIKQGDYTRMASLGLYRHDSVGPGPYSEWMAEPDTLGPRYVRQTRALTPEEVNAAFDAAVEPIVNNLSLSWSA